MNLSLDRLPGIDYWGARVIDRQIDIGAVVGGFVGWFVSSTLNPPITSAATGVGLALGWPFGILAHFILLLLTGWILLVAIANWNQIDSETETDSS